MLACIRPMRAAACLPLVAVMAAHPLPNRAQPLPVAAPQFNIGHLEAVSGAQEAIKQAGWDGVLLGGNYVAGAPRCWGLLGAPGAGLGGEGGCCSAERAGLWGPQACAAGSPQLATAALESPPTPQALKRRRRFPPRCCPSNSAAGVALGKCIEYGYTFADQIAQQLKASPKAA